MTELDALDRLARYRGALELLGVAVCGEPWRRIWARDEDAALRCVIVRLAAERQIVQAMSFEKLAAPAHVEKMAP